MKTLTKHYAAIDALIILLLLAVASSVNADPGDIVIVRDVPPQRWDVNRHVGQPTVVNPSPVNETNSLKGLSQGITELTDQQFSGITSNVNANSMSVNTSLADTLTHQLGGHGNGGAMSSQMGAVHGITSGLGGSISGSVGSATRSLGSDIRGALSDTFPGR